MDAFDEQLEMQVGSAFQSQGNLFDHGMTAGSPPPPAKKARLEIHGLSAAAEQPQRRRIQDTTHIGLVYGVPRETLNCVSCGMTTITEIYSCGSTRPVHICCRTCAPRYASGCTHCEPIGKPMQRDTWIEQSVAPYLVPCANAAHGCAFVGLGYPGEHACEYRPVACPCCPSGVLTCFDKYLAHVLQAATHPGSMLHGYNVKHMPTRDPDLIVFEVFHTERDQHRFYAVSRAEPKLVTFFDNQASVLVRTALPFGDTLMRAPVVRTIYDVMVEYAVYPGLPNAVATVKQIIQGHADYSNSLRW